jgi:hypothetical protein
MLDLWSTQARNGRIIFERTISSENLGLTELRRIQETKAIHQGLQVIGPCTSVDSDKTIHPFDREAPPLKVGEEAQLRVNSEQAPSFRPGSRKVHFDFRVLSADLTQ